MRNRVSASLVRAVRYTMVDKQDVKSALSPETLPHGDPAEEQVVADSLSPDEIRDLIEEWMG
ncbi:hypothetical protein [Sabulicella glaciei]|uniref:Uncharacterized protein n=1 Tax=Sabulicella glaciei TaxID=2984948 RepID=A0ABT3P148_9PROT|nr:hypothetical protein [Roseococcus sp. MDT2-1-1]MCW8088132.1 hypothetical protein [Roseococcus sp. MDT2-1-1]